MSKDLVKNEKVRKLPWFIFISKLWNEYKSKQDELLSKKMLFLEEQAYNNLYKQYLALHTQRIGEGLDFHPSLYAMRDARAKAREVVLRIAVDGKIDKCYRARIKELEKGRI